MNRVWFSMLVWAVFVVISTLVIKFGFYITEFPITWTNALWFAFIVRLLFVINDTYRLLEREFGI